MKIALLIIEILLLISVISLCLIDWNLTKLKDRQIELLQEQNNQLWDILKELAEAVIPKKEGEQPDEVQKKASDN